ncbi:hypothetical protein AB3X52_00375 [Nocardioides sp. DS6]|uniref:Lipoprotein n=1 Tax=Nocardioides eburneus TaxID=3231482 RepID=A0ABV3SSZ4_9ACTN
MNRLALSAAGAALIALTLTACGSNSDDTASKGDQPSGGSSAVVITPTPSPTPSVTIKPFNASGYLAGNAKPTFPAGEPGQVSIVAQGPLNEDVAGGAVLPIAYRNNTGAAISHVDLSATARLNGKLVASGQSQGAAPAQVQPGEVGLAFIYFEDSKSMPDKGLKYEFTADTMPADTSSYNTAPLTVGEATYNGSSIVGTADNKTGKPLTGPYDVQVYCFAGNKLTAEVGSYADQDNDINAGAKVSFTADLYDTKCDKFTVGVSGYFQ